MSKNEGFGPDKRGQFMADDAFPRNARLAQLDGRGVR
jgi:hypothetical protein